MNTIGRILLATCAGLFAGANFVPAQPAEAPAVGTPEIFLPVLNPKRPLPSLANAFAGLKLNDRPLTISSADDLTAMLELLQSTPSVPLASLPKNRFGGVAASGFFSLRQPDFPPFPADIYGVNVWVLGNGSVILDDREVDYAALAAEAEKRAALEAAADAGGAQLRMMSSSLLNSYGNSVYLTNLVATNAGGMTAAFDIAGGTNGVPYDILTATNLSLPVSAWPWLGFGYTSNRYTFSNQPADNAFYLLAKPSRTMAVGWGENYFNQCDPPNGLTNALMIEGGGGYSVVLKNDGTAVGWGGRTSEGSIPTNLTGIAMIASGIDHKVALLTNGTVQVWDGNPLFGQNSVPAGLSNVVVISAQYLHTLALRKDGTVLSWGDPGNPALTNVPAGLTNGTAIAAGCTHNLAVKADGTVAAWGDNSRGQCTVPSGLSNVVDVAAGWAHSVALKRDGTVAVWGNNTLGELNVPAGLSNVVQIAAAGYPSYSSYTLALQKDGTVVTWGRNKASLPLNGLNNVIAIGAEYDSGFAIRTGPPTPVVTLEPTDQFLLAGDTATFAAKGQGLYGVTYQWQTNGVNLAGATNPTLTLPNVQAAQQGSYRAIVTDNAGNGSLASSNASLTLITPPVFTYQSTPTNQTTIYGKYISLAAMATAPGQTNGFPISYQWKLNGTNIPSPTATNYSFFANDTNTGLFTLTAANAAGSTNAAWQVNYTNVPDVTQDLLLIYNTNSADSTALKNYYLAHRQMVSGANVLGIGCITNEDIWVTDCQTQILNPVANWLTNNPTKLPQHVLMFYDMPYGVSPYDPDNNGGVSFQLRKMRPDWQPFVNYIIAGTLADCEAYVDKVAVMGSNAAPGQLIISASANQYGNTNFYFDDVRDVIPYGSGPGIGSLAASAVSAVSTNFPVKYVYGADNGTLAGHITNGINAAGYLSWGGHSSLDRYYPTNGFVKWSGNSSWWIIETVESNNGKQVSDQGNFIEWFSSNAFGGLNYSNTPVGAVCHSGEPGLSGVNNSAIYFGLWASGKSLPICAWNSARTHFLVVIGDPFIKR
jgi:hypothetical protein